MKGKVNTVLMRDVNHHQLDTFWRGSTSPYPLFIELMETGEAASCSASTISLAWCCAMNCSNAAGSIKSVNAATARRRSLSPDYEGEIGLIMPYEKTSAPAVTAAVSSIGKLHLCLFGDGGVDLRELLGDDAEQQALEARIASVNPEKADPLPASGQYRITRICPILVDEMKRST
ncbi:hypothetical protein ACNKHQ_04330 [Shigella flexneri]